MRVQDLAILALFPLCLSAVPAWGANCTDPAGPGVDWERCYFDNKELAGHILTQSHLVDASFQRTDLSKSDLSNANGYRVKFISARLPEAKLEAGNFAEADFTKADLSGANMRNADFRRARFFKAILRKSDLTGARTQGADFTAADLSGAIWTDGHHICAEGSLGQCN